MGSVVETIKTYSPAFVRTAYRTVRRAASFVPRQLFGTVTHIATSEPVAALTFDDGPHPEFTPHLLEILHEYGAHATFFVVGESASKYPNLLQRMVEAGHAIGNHSWDHPSFPAIGSRERRRQMRACEEAIGPHSQRLFRPPYGNQNMASRFDAWRLGYSVVTWSADGGDWHDDSADTVFSRLASGLRPGSILLLHDALNTAEEERYSSREATLEAVRMLLGRYSGEYRFITVPELLRRGRAGKELWYQPGEADYLAALRKVRA
jgi:peptidoglycan-N-acetylglucosamine deacetylase